MRTSPSAPPRAGPAGWASLALPASLVLAGAVSVQAGAGFAARLFSQIPPAAVTTLRLWAAALILLAIGWRGAARAVASLVSRRAWRDAGATVSFGIALATMNFAIYQSFARYRPVEAVDAAVEEEQEPETSETPVYDIETPEGLQTLKRILKRIEPADAFATIRPGRDGRATARVLRRSSRRVIAAATAADESTLRSVIREILPNVMLDVAMKPPG